MIYCPVYVWITLEAKKSYETHDTRDLSISRLGIKASSKHEWFNRATVLLGLMISGFGVSITLRGLGDFSGMAMLIVFVGMATLVLGLIAMDKYLWVHNWVAGLSIVAINILSIGILYEV